MEGVQPQSQIEVLHRALLRKLRVAAFRLSTLDFQKKRFFKRFQFLKKRFYHEKKRFFFALTISDFRAKKGFVLKKRFFSSPISYTSSG